MSSEGIGNEARETKGACIQGGTEGEKELKGGEKEEGGREGGKDKAWKGKKVLSE